MLETELRELFERQASGDQPPTRISGEQLISDGRSRLRIRRVGAFATPLLAAAAVTGIVLVALMSGAVLGRQHRPGPGPATGATAPSYFSSLRPYLTFGWLPRGMKIISGNTGTISQFLSAGRSGKAVFWLTTWSALGQCHVSNLQWQCQGAGPNRLSRMPSDIDGHPAYWNVDRAGAGVIYFHYARGGWAQLSFYDGADALKIAEHLILAPSADAPRFPAQLFGLPGWQVQNAQFNARPDGSLAVNQFGLASGPAVNAPEPGPADYPWLSISRAGKGAICYSTPRQSSRSVIAGHQVMLTNDGDYHELCATHDDGLRIFIYVSGSHPAISVTDVFKHLRLLGPNLAAWTTKPVG